MITPFILLAWRLVLSCLNDLHNPNSAVLTKTDRSRGKDQMKISIWCSRFGIR